MPSGKIVQHTLFSIYFFLGILIASVLFQADQAQGGLVINEIVAGDISGGHDWIEFYVTGHDPVFLGNYTVVDDREDRVPAPLPDITLEPGEFFVIEATDEDPDDDFSYVPFKLGSDDCVTLYWGTDIVDVLDWMDGDATAGYSYGRLPDGSGVARTLAPTPDTANEPAFPMNLIINEIMARDADGGPDWIELYVTGSAPVYLGDYALADDSPGRTPALLPDITLNPGEFIVIQATDENPGDESFYVPFKLGSDDCVSLYWGPYLVDMLDWVNGQAPVGISYGRLPNGTGKAQSLTPTPGSGNKIFEVFQESKVGVVRVKMYEAAFQDILDNPMAEQYQLASIEYNGVKVDNVAIRVKGNSSLSSVARDPNSNRYSFKVDFNHYVKGQHLGGLQKLNFNNGFSDPTFLREFISYKLMRSFYVSAPRCSFANLYINSEFMGLYLVVEAVDDEFVKSRFEKGNGDLYKAEMGSSLLWDDDSSVAYTGLELKTNEDTSHHQALMAMLSELNKGGDYESVLDVAEVLRYLAVNTFLVNLDSYVGQMAQNYYLYEENGIFRIIPWDFNMSFGGFSMSCERDQIIEFMIDEPTTGKLSDRPLVAKLLANSEYLDMYHDYLNAFLNLFPPQSIYQLIDNTTKVIREHVYADSTKFYTNDDFEEALVDDLETDPNDVTIIGFNRGFGSVIGLKTFIIERMTSIRDQLDGLAPASGDGWGCCPNPWDRWAEIDIEEAIEKVSPSYALPGTAGIKVTIRLDDKIMDLLSDQEPESVMIGTAEGYNIELDGDTITAVFNFPLSETVGMKSVSVAFEAPEGFEMPEGWDDLDWEDFDPADFPFPEGGQFPGGMPAGGFGGQFPGGMPPGGFGGQFPGGMPAGGFGGMGGFNMAGFIDGDNIVFSKAEAFEVGGSYSSMSMPQTGYSGYVPQMGYYSPQGYPGLTQSGYPMMNGFFPQAGYSGYALPSGYSSAPGYSAQFQSGYPMMNGFFPQAGYSGYVPQMGYYSPQGYPGLTQSGYPMMNGFFPQAGYSGYALPSGYSSPPGYPAQFQSGYPMMNGFFPQAGYSGYALPSGYSSAPGYSAQFQSGYPMMNGFFQQTGYGFFPQLWYAPQNNYWYRP